jgi:hypothetical protein
MTKKYHLPMSTNEAFTSGEIMDVLTDIGVEVTFESADENEARVATIDCGFGPFEFWCFLIIREPFFEGLRLQAERFNVQDPVRFATDFNNEIRVARAVVVLDSDGLVMTDEDGAATVNVQADLYFAGGITKEHMKFIIEMWIEDLVDFYEIVLEEDDDNDSKNLSELREFATASLLDQIVACLSGAQSMTSREIAKLLDNDRHVINSILYKERDRFVHDAAQPPRWSLKE